MHNQCPVEKNIFIFCCKKNFVINDFWLMCTTQRQFSHISIWTQYIMKFDRVKCLSTSFVQLIYTNVTFVHLWDNFFLNKIWTLHVFHQEQTLTRVKDIVVTWHYQLEPGLACDWNETRDCFLGNEYSITNYRSV